MTSPHANAWNIEIDVLSGLELPGFGHAQGHSHGITWKSFNLGPSAALSAEVVA